MLLLAVVDTIDGCMELVNRIIANEITIFNLRLGLCFMHSHLWIFIFAQCVPYFDPEFNKIF